MDSSEAAFEADAGLNAAALQQNGTNDGRRPKGERTGRAAKGGIDTSTEQEREEQANEDSPLLSREDGDRKQSFIGMEEFEHLPWYSKPNIYWVLFPFFLMTLAFGGVITPKVNLILELICREYINERQSVDPGFTMAPVNFANGGDNDQCRIPEVQARVSVFTLWGSLIAGIISAFTSPKLGALSDRYGRKSILIVTSVGTIAGEILTIIAATYPETFPVHLLLVGYAFEGLTGSFIVAMAIANSYATDCTPPSERNVAFGYFHATLFTGIALGPILAGYIVKDTGKIVIVFYILLAVHVFFIFFIAIAVPESLSKRRQLEARATHKQHLIEQGPDRDWINQLRALNVFEPLKILWPTGPGSSPALRRNLIVLAAVDTIVFGVAMSSLTVVIIYTNYEFGWKVFESARFMTVVNSSRVVMLIVVLPIVTRLVRGKVAKHARNTGCDLFDLTVMRVAVLFDTLGYLGYTLARKGSWFTLAGAVASAGGIGPPALQSALTKHVSPSHTGQLLGASGLLHALSRVVAPTLFQAIYAATVGKYTQTVFVCLTSTFGLAFVISWFIKPHREYFEHD